jgi:RNA polymerase sigma-70 factor, ECF subfamily
VVLVALRLERAAPAVDTSSVDAARRGDRQAFARLFEQHGPLVHGILLSRVPRDEADDLVQDVFVTALERVATLRDSLAFGPWLATIARNRVTDFLRARPTVVELPDDLVAADSRAAEVSQVLAKIRALPEAFREPLVLRLVEGMSCAEIAERCGFTYDSVRVNLFRGMQRLRASLGIEVAR